MLFFVAILPIFIVGVEKVAYPKRGAIFFAVVYKNTFIKKW